MRCGRGFPPNACENSKHPKGMPLAPNFSYLNHSTFYTTSNVRINSFHSFWSHSALCFRPTFDLNISFISKQNWTCEYTTFIINGRRTHSNHFSCILSNRSCLKFQHKSSQPHLTIWSFLTIPTMNGDSRKYAHYETDSIMKNTFEKKLHQKRWTRPWTLRSENFVW